MATDVLCGISMRESDESRTNTSAIKDMRKLGVSDEEAVATSLADKTVRCIQVAARCDTTP